MMTEPASPPSGSPGGVTASLPRSRVALLFTVMLVTAAGNTAMQSVMPSIGTALQVEDFWISLAYTWSALLWMLCAPFWARRSDRRGRKAMMALGLMGFISSFGLCGMALWLGLHGYLGALGTLLLFAACRSLYGGPGLCREPHQPGRTDPVVIADLLQLWPRHRARAGARAVADPARAWSGQPVLCLHHDRRGRADRTAAAAA